MSELNLAESIAQIVGAASIASMAKSAPAPVRTIDAVTQEILAAKGQVVDGYLTIGARLIEAKEMLEHGEWLPWLRERVDISERHAQNLMRVAREYSNPQALAGLGLSKAVALLSVPVEERDEFIEAHPVAEMSTRELEQVIRERDAAIEAAKKSEARFDKANAEANEYLEQAEKAETRAKAAEARVKELETAPREVYRDEAAIEAAKKETTEKWQKKVTALEAKLKKAEDAAKKDGAAAELEQLRAELAAAKKSAAEESEVLRREMDTLRKENTVAGDADLALCRELLSQMAEHANKLHGLLLKARNRSDETTAAAIQKAMRSLAAQIGRCAE